MSLISVLLASWKRHDRRTTFAVCLLLFSAFSLATLKPLWISQGWPKNHEGFAFAVRTRIYEQHYRLHEIIPLWSCVDNQGFGSPMPVMYHKLFYSLSGPLYFATGNLKASVVLPVFLFLLVGAFGMFRLLQVLGASRATGIAAGICLIAARYTATNWLIRGALAEFSAAMLIPWALYYFLRSLHENRVRIGLAVSITLIFLGHSVIGYYLGLLFSALFLVSIVVRHTRLTGEFLGSTLKAGLIFGLLVAPFLIAMATFAPDYDMKRIVAAPYHPCLNFPDLRRFFWDDLFVFGSNWAAYSVQLDLPPLLFGIGGLVGLIFFGNRGKKWETAGPILPLVALGIAAFFLQTQYAAPFYDHVPGAAYLQFPWRLLGLLTPVVIATGLYFAEKGTGVLSGGGGVAWCSGSMALLCGGFFPTLYGNLPPGADLDAPLVNICFSSGAFEYIPKSVPLPPKTEEAILSNAKAKGCSISYQKPDREVRRMVFKLNSSSEATIELPLYVTPLHIVKVFNAKGDLIHQTKLGSLSAAGICTVEVPEGKARVDIEMPDLKKLFKFWAARLKAKMHFEKASGS